MTDSDPPRLADPSAPPGLRDVLRAAQGDVGSDAQLARLAQRLGPLLGPTPPLAPASVGVTGAKLGLAGVALLVAAGGAWLLSSTPAGSPSSAPPPRMSAPAASPLAVQPSAAAPESAPSSSVDELPAPATPEVAANPPPLPAKPAPPVLPSEAALLEQARAALKSAPGLALQRANEHAARFPRGVLVQEREVMAIQALRRLGRNAEAERRAAAFVKAFPGSAFARQLQAAP